MENEAIVRRLYEEVWNSHNVKLVDELCARHSNRLAEPQAPRSDRVSARTV
jgi:hypothetical protein